jgi:hypothetical protein
LNNEAAENVKQELEELRTKQRKTVQLSMTLKIPAATLGRI